MPTTYIATDFDNIVLDFGNGTSRLVAKTDCSAGFAVKLLNDAKFLNDVKRKYTAAARKIAQAEALPGFEWIDAASEE